MTTFVASDLHLDEESQARLFHDERQGKRLATLAESLRNDDELVLLGDVFDFTAMSPPPQGLGRFFQRMEMPQEPPHPQRDLAALCAAARESNPIAMAALERLSRRSKVTMVPGNHDRHLADPDAPAAFASIGLGAVKIERFVQRDIGGRTVVMLHGHEFDKSNAQPHGPGETMTNALHHAVVPFLRHHGARRNVKMDADRIVSLRPEENIVTVLQRWLDEKTFRRFFRALLRLLAENGLLPRPASWLAAFVSVNGVRRRAAHGDKLWEESGALAVELLRGERHLPYDAPRPDALVLGHTHVIDWAVDDARGPDDALYVNLGTWTERVLDASSPPDDSLPVLSLGEKAGRMEVLLRDLETGAELQRFEALTGRSGP